MTLTTPNGNRALDRTCVPFQRLGLFLAGFTLIATQSAALDCIQPAPQLRLSNSSADHRVLIGTFDYRGQPFSPGLEKAEERTAIFNGRVLHREGELTVTDEQVRIIADCPAWGCEVPPDGEAVMGLGTQSEDGQLLLELNPCGDSLFPVPDDAQFATMEACLRGGSCLIHD